MSDLDESAMLKTQSLRGEWGIRAQSSYNYTAQYRPLVSTVNFSTDIDVIIVTVH